MFINVCQLKSLLSRIVLKAELKQSDIVLEIGPGTGNLTTKILDHAKKVIAVELDPRMAAEVTKRFQGTPAQKRLDVILGDVMKIELPYFDVCISNTPYQVYTLSQALFYVLDMADSSYRFPPLLHSSFWLHCRLLVFAFSCMFYHRGNQFLSTELFFYYYILMRIICV
jgi:SAM-dependent methyltransferase